MGTYRLKLRILFYSLLAVALKIFQVFIKVSKALFSILNKTIRKTRKKIVPVIPHRTLRFHEIHGSNIELRNKCTIAHRIRSFNNGGVFSSTTIPHGKCVPIKVLEVRSKYKGRLLFGFTSVNPVTLCLEDLENFNNYSHAGGDEPRQIWTDALHLSQLGPSLSMSFHFNRESYMVCRTSDGIEHGIKMFGLDTSKSLWAFVHVYGIVGSVMLIDMPILGNNKYRTTENIPPRQQCRQKRNPTRIPVLQNLNTRRNVLTGRERNAENTIQSRRLF